LCNTTREFWRSDNKGRGALFFKSSEKCPETQKIKEIQSINLILMKSRAKQSDLRIKETIWRISNEWEKGQNKIWERKQKS
jgi:hypothetical protein